jgi:RNA polymerase sigma-70 factor (ECF subfamily)
VAIYRTWFYRIFFNLAHNKKRRAPFDPLEAAGDPADPAPRADDAMERRETDRLVASAIAELPARQRSAIALTYGDELSNAEAAAVLGTSVSAFETLLVRARRALRIKLNWTNDED